MAKFVREVIAAGVMGACALGLHWAISFLLHDTNWSFGNGALFGALWAILWRDEIVRFVEWGQVKE